MSVVQTLLVYVGIPATAFALLAVLVYGTGSGRAPRYRPGRGWPYQPVWYLPRPKTMPRALDAGHGQGLEAGRDEPALESGSTAVSGSLPAAAQGATARGGASGTW